MDYKVFVGSILVVVFVEMAIWVAGWLWINWPS
jgi:hypothetical protein